MNSTVSVKSHFAAGHRILGLDGEGEKCRNIHGHTFTVTWVWQQHPDIEFGRLKSMLRQVVGRFDHAFILDRTDDFGTYLDANMLRNYKLTGPPTTEAIAAEIARLSVERVCLVQQDLGFSGEPTGRVRPAVWPEARLVRVIVEEGPENCATWEGNQEHLDHVHLATDGYDVQLTSS